MAQGSSWQEQANSRRDARRTIVEVIRAPRANARNTGKWCKGKAGVLHQPALRRYADVKRLRHLGIDFPWDIVVCERCGKYLRWQRHEAA